MKVAEAFAALALAALVMVCAAALIYVCVQLWALANGYTLDSTLTLHHP